MEEPLSDTDGAAIAVLRTYLAEHEPCYAAVEVMCVARYPGCTAVRIVLANGRIYQICDDGHVGYRGYQTNAPCTLLN